MCLIYYFGGKGGCNLCYFLIGLCGDRMIVV